MTLIHPRTRSKFKPHYLHSLCLAMPLSFAAFVCDAADEAATTQERVIVAHHDPVTIDPKLSLSQLVDFTLEKYPDSYWLDALEQEAKAISQRSQSWIAGAPQAGLRYQEATSGTLHYIDAQVQVPLWNLGQREAERETGEKAQLSAELQLAATKLRIAGLVRAALWDMALQKIRYEQALAEITIFEQLLAKIKRRVELGDLPRADELLAQTELLQKRAVLTMAEAELMHARKRYASLTQTSKIPGSFAEKLVALREIQQNHPALQAANSQIERKQAELDALKLVGAGQSNVAVGINSDSFTSDPRSNKTESFNIGVNVPFGGSAHIQPHLAALNVELNRLIAERELLYRNLEQLHHEAEHNLEVNRVELGIANELKQVAEQHLGMSNTAFSVGEIDLIDLLKIQSRTQQAILNAKERAVMLERDQAFYNQAVGVLP
ncbi:MAG: TolC family protein [Methylovulum sp.]|nr:TolC family protein [Methylovulum sp.]